MRNKKKALLTLAVAQASMIMALDAAAIDYPVTLSGDDVNTVGTLRHAIANAGDGDTVTINTTQVSEISLLNGELVTDKALILSAAVGPDGTPQVTIRTDAEDHRLLTLLNGSGDPIPFVISGLEFTGAVNNDIGGAIMAQNHALILDKSTVSGNTAIGAGGGVAVERGELCLQGSRLTGNTVYAGEGVSGFYAFGGGAAVNGMANVMPVDSSGGEDGPNCLTERATSEGGIIESISATFAATAEALSDLPEGVDIIPSEISGNSALLDETSFFYSKYVAAGGGLAIFEGDLNAQDSILLSSTCSSGGAYSPQCNLIFGSSVTGNTVSATVQDGEGGHPATMAAGGGIFVGSAAIEIGQFIAVKYADVSDNSVTLEGEGGTFNNFAVGGGIAAVSSDIPFGVSSFWNDVAYDTEEPEDEVFDDPAFVCEAEGGGGPFGDNTCGNTVAMGGSTISGNMLTLDMSAAEDGPSGKPLHVATGGGVAAINALNDEEPQVVYPDWFDGEGEGSGSIEAIIPVVQSYFSSVSGNMVTASASESFSSSTGGGIAAGTTMIALPGLKSTELPAQEYGKYVGFFSGNTDNQVVVTGENNAEITAGGGGVSSAIQFIIGKKPEFEIISEEPGEGKYGLPVSDALFTSPGGITANTVDVTTGAGDVEAVLGGGGAFANAKYSATIGSGAVVTGNQVIVNSDAGEGSIIVGGGGAGQTSVDGEGVSIALWKYSEISDNSVTVTGTDFATVEAFGGGFGADTAAGENFGGPASIGFEYSEVSGNSVSVVSPSSASFATGGGISAGEVFNPGGPSKYSSIINTTIANNSAEFSGGESGSAMGGGLFIDGSDSDFGIHHTTIVGNTSAQNGTAKGGQAYLDISSSGFEISNSLISGDIAQGDKDLYYDADPSVTATAVFHADPTPLAGFLDAAVADPAFLGDLQFNGFDGLDGPEKYGFTAAPATIALLSGSPAIDPTDGSCVSDDAASDDQRGYSRDDCSDLGAYEFMAEEDDDSLVDGTELDAAGTIADILAGQDTYPAPFGILLESGDGNSDGLPDVDQDDVASFTHDTAGPLTLFVSGVEGDGEFGTEPDLSGVTQLPGMMAGNFDLSLGGVSFVVETGSDDVTVEMSLVASALPGEMQLVKQQCNPADLPAGPDDGWIVLDDTPEPFGPDRVIFTFDLEADGPLDCNGADDDIEDPIFIAYEAPVAAPVDDAADPVAPPKPIPTLPTALYGLLTGALALLGLNGTRSRRRKSAK